jgi:hypothetical protein
MNIITSLIARIEDYRKTNKNPCKNYCTYAAAEKAVIVAAAKAGKYFDSTEKPARYVVFFNPEWKRYNAALDYTELLSRKTAVGGYLGAVTGFFTY